MMPTYVTALVEERRGPRLSPELERYLRSEYGPGTGAGYLLAELERASSRRRPSVRKSARAVIEAIAKALTRLGARPSRKSRAEVSARPGPHA